MTDTITLPREVIERAISALQGCYDVDSYPNNGSTQQDASLNELRAALAQQAEPISKDVIVREAVFGLYENNYLCYHLASAGPSNVEFTFDKNTRQLVYAKAIGYYAKPQVAQQAEQVYGNNASELQRHNDYMAGFNEGYDRATLFASQQAEQEWQDIDTAPRETKIFIGKFINGKFKFGRSEMFYEQANEFAGETFSGWVWSEDEVCIQEPTHWMPLPNPPTDRFLLTSL